MIHQFKTLDSTNAYALEHAADLATGDLVVADTQTAGRGRRERKWSSPAGGNFYGSFVVKPEVKDFMPTILPQLAAVAVKDVLPPFGITDAWIKWPNDIFVGDRKLAGVLIESCIQPGGQEVFVVGIGVNLNTSRDELAAIDRPATSIVVETGVVVDVPQFIEAMDRAFQELWRLVDDGRQGEIHQRWTADNPLIGQNVELLDGGTAVHGTVVAMRESGALALETEQGIKEFMAGDVSLRF